MPTARDLRAFFSRLDGTIAKDAQAARRVTVAYSRGLASTVVGAFARKRADVRCVVAGTKGSPDVRAANLAKDYLDYRIDVVQLSRPSVLALIGEIREDHPGLTRAEQHALVPLWAFLATIEPPVLAGFGAGRLRPVVRDALRDARVRLPIAIAPGKGTSNRTRLRDVARELGLPTAFAEVRRRPPAVGAGIAEILRPIHNENPTSDHTANSDPGTPP